MVALVQKTLLEKLPSREEKFTTLESLREACEGKMYTEREYAQCTTMMIEILVTHLCFVIGHKETQAK